MKYMYGLPGKGSLLLALLFFVSSLAVAQVNVVPDGGQFEEPVLVELFSTDPSVDIYYTLDGSRPTTTSQKYDGEILITKNTVLKARAYNGSTPSGQIAMRRFAFPTRITGHGESVSTFFTQGEVTDKVFTLLPDQFAIDSDGTVIELETGDTFTRFDQQINNVIGAATQIGYDLTTIVVYREAGLALMPGELSSVSDPDVYDGIVFGTGSTLSFTTGVAVGGDHAAYLGSDGRAHVWGDNGNQNRVLDRDFVKLSAGGNRTVGLKSDSTVYSWTANESGDKVELFTPPGLDDVVMIASNTIYDFALRQDGTLKAWAFGMEVMPPVGAGLSNIVKIDARGETVAILTSDGNVHGVIGSDAVSIPTAATAYNDIQVFDGSIFTFEPADIIRDWELTIVANSENEDAIELNIGSSPYALEHAFFPVLDVLAPPPPPEGVFHIAITGNDTDYFTKYLPTAKGSQSWRLLAQKDTGSDTYLLEWDNIQVQTIPGNLIMEVYNTSDPEEIRFIDMSLVQALEFTSEEVVITYYPEGEVPDLGIAVDYEPGWQLVGLPYTVSDYTPSMIFNESVLAPSTFYEFDGKYKLANNFEEGRGYWQYFLGSDNVGFSEFGNSEYEISLKEGWNLVTGPLEDAAIEDFEQWENVIPGTLTGYNSGYFITDTLTVGRGYWLKADSEVTLVYRRGVLLRNLPDQPKLSEPPGFARISVKGSQDARSTSFFLGGNLDELADAGIDVRSFSQPPRPPRNAFDIRMTGSSRISTSQEAVFDVQSPGEELVVAFHPESFGRDAVLELSALYGGEEAYFELSDGEEVHIPGDGLTSVQARLVSTTSVDPYGEELPADIHLAQNFPNPFNPTTTIRFALPEAGEVRLSVYDITGRQVAVLLNQSRSAGTHDIIFDASALSSGVYVYRLEAGGQVMTRKLTLIK